MTDGAPSDAANRNARTLMSLAVLVATAFDQLFVRVRIPGVGWAIWILATIFSFAGFAYVSGKREGSELRKLLLPVALSAVSYALLGGYLLTVTGAKLTALQAAPAALQSFILALIGGISGARRGVSAWARVSSQRR